MIRIFIRVFLLITGILFFHHLFLYALRWIEIMNSDRLSEEEKRIPLHITREGVRNFLREMAWSYLVLPFWSLRSWVEGPWSQMRRHGEEPILFIHGYSQNSTNGWRIMRALRRAGFSNLVSITLENKYGRIARMAEQVAAKVEALCLESKSEKVTIVAHSMGGLVSRYYIQKLGGDARVRRLVTLGTPHKGSKIAGIALGDAAREMLVGGKFIRELNEDLSAFKKVDLVAVWSPFDALIIPYESAQNPAGGDEVKLDGLGHLGLLFEPRSIEAVLGVVKGIEIAEEPAVQPVIATP